MVHWNNFMAHRNNQMDLFRRLKHIYYYINKSIFFVGQVENEIYNKFEKEINFTFLLPFLMKWN